MLAVLLRQEDEMKAMRKEFYKEIGEFKTLFSDLEKYSN
jgi:hypothetical protein